MRVAQIARALDQATLKNYLSAGVNLVLAMGIITIALRGGVRPIFVPYDQFGRVIRTEDLGRFREPPRRFIDAALAEWIVSVRRLYYGDPLAQLDLGRAAKALLAPAAEQWLDQYFAALERNPVQLLKTTSRTVDGVTMSKDPDRNVWTPAVARDRDPGPRRDGRVGVGHAQDGVLPAQHRDRGLREPGRDPHHVDRVEPRVQPGRAAGGPGPARSDSPAAGSPFPVGTP